MRSARRALDWTRRDAPDRPKSPERRYEVALRRAASAEEPAYAEGLALKALAELDVIDGRLDQAAERYGRARLRLESCREPEHPRILEVLDAQAGVCRKLGRDGDANALDAVLEKRWKLYPLAGSRDRALRSRWFFYEGKYRFEGIDHILHPLPDRRRLIEATGSPLSSSACHLARWYRVRGWYDMAEEVYRYALECTVSNRHPVMIEAMEGLVDLLHEVGRSDEVGRLAFTLQASRRKRWYHQEAKRVGGAERLAEAWLEEAHVLESVSAWEAAFECARRALALEPADRRTWRQAQRAVAALCRRLGRLTESEEMCRRLLLDASEAQDHYLLAQTLEQLQRPAEAARSYLEANRLCDEWNPFVLIRLHGLVAEHPEVAGEVPGVREVLERAKESAVFVNRPPDVH